MGQGIIFTTWDWTKPQYTSKYWEKTTNPYGQVYSRVIQGLGRRGWKVQNIFQHPRFKSKQLSLSEEKSLLQTLLRIARNQPTFVFHDHLSFFHQNCQTREKNGKNGSSIQETSELECLLQEDLFWQFRGRVEFVHPTNKVSWDGEVCVKDQFYRIAQSLNIPVPETLVIKDTSSPDVKYRHLARHLTGSDNGEIMLKAVESAGGEGVYKAGSQDDLFYFNSQVGKHCCAVAQRKLPLPNQWPYSIRVVAWQDHVIGAALLVNPNHAYRSNARQGGSFTFDLALPGANPRRNLQSLHGVKQSDRNTLFDIAKWCSIDLSERVIPEEIFYYTQLFGQYESNALLKGLDFMYDRGNKPLAIEANMHPGPPGTGMFSAINGEKGVAEEREIRLATTSILNAILSNP